MRNRESVTTVCIAIIASLGWGVRHAWAEQGQVTPTPRPRPSRHGTITRIPSQDPFLSVQCRTPEELIQQFRKSPRLTQLYARHFGIPPADLYPFLRENLRLVRLSGERR